MRISWGSLVVFSTMNETEGHVGAPSPEILAAAWGRISVAGFSEVFKDVKLYPGGAREWDWTETGTQHVPGIQASDLKELVDAGADVVVLSTGYLKRLRITPEALAYLEEHGVRHLVAQTEAAIEEYNHVRRTDMAGALIHSTC